MSRIIEYEIGSWRMGEEPKQTTMKKYRLLKDLFPLKKGEELKPVSALAYGSFKEGVYHLELENSLVESNPEWFEEVKGETWRILSFKGLIESNAGAFSLKSDGLYYHDCWKGRSINGITEDSLLTSNQDSIEIHQVERLSDGVIFAVGDLFQYSSYPTLYKITSFQIRDGRLEVCCKGYSGAGSIFQLENITKVKAPTNIKWFDSMLAKGLEDMKFNNAAKTDTKKESPFNGINLDPIFEAKETEITQLKNRIAELEALSKIDCQKIIYYEQQNKIR